MHRDASSRRRVPGVVAGVLGVSLLLQLGLHHGLFENGRPPVSELGAPPGERLARAMSFGEPWLMSRLLMLWMQSFDTQAGVGLPLRELDYGLLVRWLELALRLDPESRYPLFAATLLYARVPDPGRSRAMLDFVHRAFLERPARRWSWLARAVTIARHHLEDPDLARRYAADLRRHTRPGEVPDWARHLEPLLLEDLGELEAARILLGGLLQSGEIRDPAEARFLAERLKALEARLGRRDRPAAE